LEVLTAVDRDIQLNCNDDGSKGCSQTGKPTFKLTPAAEVLIAGAPQILALRDEVVATARSGHHGSAP